MSQEIDYEKLGESIARHAHQKCPLNLTAEDAQVLHRFVQDYQTAKSRALTIFVGAAVLAVLTLVAKGLKAYIAGPFQ